MWWVVSVVGGGWWVANGETETTIPISLTPPNLTQDGISPVTSRFNGVQGLQVKLELAHVGTIP